MTPTPFAPRRSEPTMRNLACLSFFALAAACGSTPATPEQRRLAEERLLAPYLRDVQIGCSELLVEMTANFHGNVGQPAVDATAHDVRREDGPGYVDTIWTNRTGLLRSALNVTIGERAEFTERGLERGPHTRITAMNQVRLRVYRDQRPLQLDLAAGGPVVLVQEAGQARREVRTFAVRDGAVQMP